MHPLRQFERYTLLGEIAGGGMGVVYQAVHHGLNRSCALKLIRGGVLASADERRRFVTEAEAVARLDHPNVVRVTRAGEHDGQLFLEMELIEGGTLADLIADGPLPAKEAVPLIERLARAVQHAHERGILHRDLKPGNVLLTPEGQPKLADFGLARFLEPGGDLTRTLAVLGTPAYLAPELASGRAADATIAADIYSLGVILFECLTGQRPFRGNSPLETLRAVQETTTPRPSALRPGIPRDLEIITLRCLAKEPARRFNSAGELADELARYLHDEPIQSRPVSALECLWLWTRRKPAVAALILAILAGIGASSWFFKRETAARQSNEIVKADSAARTGRWREAMAHWDAAERAGYRDAIDLGLKRAEAHIILMEWPQAQAEYDALLRRHELGVRSNAVHLRFGDFQMHDHGTAEQGVQRVRLALTNGLNDADQWLARGLLAESTPDALAAFRQALRYSSSFPAAHRHSLGLEFVLGRHEDFTNHLEMLRVLQPGEFSPGFLEAAHLALQGRLEDALANLAVLTNKLSQTALADWEKNLRFLASAASAYETDNYLTYSKAVRDARRAFLPSAAGFFLVKESTNGPRSGLPALPCIRQGIKTGLEGVAALMVSASSSREAAMEKVREGWRRHPESMIPFMAAASLESQHPREGGRSPDIMALQSELYQIAAVSRSVIPNFARIARLQAVDVQGDMATNLHPQAAWARAACLTNLQSTLAAEIESSSECIVYFKVARQLNELDLARGFLSRWEQLKPGDDSALRNRIRLELASGAYGPALKFIERALIANPEDTFAKAQREKARRELKKLTEQTLENTPPK